MPIYVYKCKSCGTEFEMQQKMSDEPLKVCPPEICNCAEKGQGEVQRIFSSNIGLMFKGTGFYKTDYTSNSASKEKLGNSSSESCSTCAVANN